MSEEIDFNDLDAVIDTAEIKQEGNSEDFALLPKGTYPAEIAKVEFSNYQPKPGKTSGIRTPCKQIKLGLLVDGGDKGKAWADENLYFYPTCMFKIVSVFKACGLIPDGYKGAFPWDQLKGASCLVKLDVESYHSVKYGDDRERNIVKTFSKPVEKPAAEPAADKDPWETEEF